MIRLTLNETERLLLTQTMKTTVDRRLRDRCQAILMADRGRRHGHIAEDLSVSGRTIQRWLNTYQAHGLDGLQLQWAPGRTHHRLFTTIAQLKSALRNSLSYYHTLKHRVLSLIQSPRNRTKSAIA